MLASDYRQAGSRYYLLAILTLIYTVNFIDRQLLAILQEPIKAELALSDGQLGLLTGFAFAIFYVTAGIPIALMSDRSNRRNIIAGALVLWSAMTSLCGLAQNFTQLLLARIGVGVGEAGCSPAAHSMISDVFPSRRRATVLSIYSSGINIGILFGFLLGGWLNEFFGWRVAFVVVGLPGVMLALLFRFTVSEPQRGFSDGQVTKVDNAVSFGEAVAVMWSRSSMRHLIFAGSLTAFTGYGISSWLASYIIRTYGMGTGELGTWLALTMGLFGAFGTLLSGIVADYFGQRDVRWYLWLPGCAAALAMPAFVLTMSADTAYATLVLSILPTILSTVYVGSCVAMIHALVGFRMRAMGSAVFYFIINIIGLGFGPFLIGMASDLLQPAYAEQSLRYAMIFLITGAGVWSILHYVIAARFLREDLARVPA